MRYSGAIITRENERSASKNMKGCIDVNNDIIINVSEIVVETKANGSL